MWAESLRNETRDVLANIWRAVEQATTQRTGFTRATLATATTGGQPRARSVIVRDFSTDPERIGFATDIRAAKVAELQRNPQVALVFYNDDTAVQCRAEGSATLVTDDAVRHRAWQMLAPHTQQTYASAAIPGAALNSVDASDDRTPFERFGWISIELHSLDWLDLSEDPHQRWQFQRHGTSWSGQRITP